MSPLLLFWLAALPIADWRTRIEDTLHVPRPLPPLAAEMHGKFEPEPGIVMERVSYATQLGMRVPAIVYRPSNQAIKRPALIIVNGHGGDKYAWYAMYSGIAYARLGTVVLTYDPAGEGERNIERKSGTRAHDKVIEPERLGPWMGGLMMTDARQAVSYLSSRSDVDPARIAAVGYSMGSFVLGLTCAVETRLRACVLVGGGNLDGPGEYWDKSKPMCQGMPYKAVSFLGDRPAALYAMHADRGATLVYNGLADTVVAIPSHGPEFFDDLRKRTIALSGSERNVFETGFVPGVSHRPFFVTQPVAAWLHKHLQFPANPNWQILGETRIGTWAQERGVAMDPLYSEEHREGGAMGIGHDVPGLKREVLSVFSDSEWQARRDSLIHEGWLAKVPR